MLFFLLYLMMMALLAQWTAVSPKSKRITCTTWAHCKKKPQKSYPTKQLLMHWTVCQRSKSAYSCHFVSLPAVNVHPALKISWFGFWRELTTTLNLVSAESCTLLSFTVKTILDFKKSLVFYCDLHPRTPPPNTHTCTVIPLLHGNWWVPRILRLTDKWVKADCNKSVSGFLRGLCASALHELQSWRNFTCDANSPSVGITDVRYSSHCCLTWLLFPMAFQEQYVSNIL